jgi:glycosyltransferase involved in cell wall biosynthesis
VPHLKALIVGAPVQTAQSQQYYRRLQALTESLDLASTVVFTGFRSDIVRLMSAMDVVVLSSSTPEPFGRVVIEGMAAGRPVVATAAGGVLDIIQDGIDGRLVPIGDADAMSQAIVDLFLEPDKAEQIGQAARRRIEACFALPQQVATIEKVYDTILGTRPRDRGQIQWQLVLDAPGLLQVHSC